MLRSSSDTHNIRSLGDRRKESRHRLILRVSVLEQEGRTSFCLAKNISSTGMQVRFYVPPILDAPVSVRVADEPAVDGHVLWKEGDVAGIQFREVLDSDTLLRVRQKLRANRRRTMPRVDVEASAILRSGGRILRAVVCDISSLGARVRSASPLDNGDRAVVQFAGLPSLTAFVRWTDGEESGLAFETPIPMPIIAHWISSVKRLSV